MQHKIDNELDDERDFLNGKCILSPMQKWTNQIPGNERKDEQNNNIKTECVTYFWTFLRQHRHAANIVIEVTLNITETIITV